MFKTVRTSMLALIGGFLLAGALFVPAGAQAQVNCGFARILGFGAYGADVQCLQTWLATQGYFTAQATGYYGPVTRDAVIRWQAAQGIAATGVFAPGTIGRQLPPLAGAFTNNGQGALRQFRVRSTHTTTQSMK